MTEHRFAVRVKPGARVCEVGGRWDGRHGPALVVAVTARAVDGKANEAVCQALADALGVRRSSVAIVRGERSRDKLVVVRSTQTESDAEAAVTERVSRLIG
jgi:uncharacterized protein YggU (UPF0235/DUF167 family)